MAKVTKSEYTEQLQRLREWLPPGSTLYTICESVSRSGMQRTIRVLIPTVDQRPCDCHTWPEGSPHYIGAPRIDHLHPNYAVSVITGYSLDKRNGYNGVRIGGCGMDMGFSLVYSVSSALYGGKRCDCGQWYLRRPAQHGIPALGEWEYLKGEDWQPYLQGATSYGSNGRPTEGETGGAEYIYRYTANCEKCKGGGNVIGTGYQCLGQGKCPSSYHNNHRDRIRCEGVERNGAYIRCAAPQTYGRFAADAETIAGWPKIKLGKRVEMLAHTLFTEAGDYGREVCPTCKGKGDLPNPEGPERFDLEHFDGYAIRHRWL